VFPLDHFGECKALMHTYLTCLQEKGQNASPCRELSRSYLECRMERELMVKQPLEQLGFGGVGEGAGGEAGGEARAKDGSKAGDVKEKPKGNYIGGTRYVEAGKQASAEREARQR